MENKNFCDALFEHARSVKIETSVLRDKVRGMRIVGMDALADNIEFSCDMLDKHAAEIRDQWVTYIKADTQRINESVGETLKAFVNKLPVNDQKGA